jgi:mannose-1-phosphate guanylyltransferase
VLYLVYPVPLWGGPSTPLWHLCCTSCPKQLLRHFSDESQFRATERRLWDDGLASPLVITGSDYCFIISELLQDASIVTGFVHIEPEVHDIAPAILAPLCFSPRPTPTP